jgi:hypothetical protein
MTGQLTPGQSSCYVALGLVDRLVELVPISNAEEAARVEEVVQMDVVSEDGPSHLALARLQYSNGAWQLDDTFTAARLNV